MEQQHDIQQDLTRILNAWQTDEPGEAFFATLPAVIQERAATRRAPIFALTGLLAHGFTAAAAVALIAAGLWNVHSQTASNEKLISEAAAWSTEQRPANTTIPVDDLIDAQGAGLDESLGTAVEGMSIENTNGYQLLDGLDTEELELLAAELNKGKG
ncbi:MAG: hypothetical protein QME74_11935 [Candidatus Edwardsbacteria bacterium]|nr:hypothetical protein [Candidatus Edwardsbacteria bacterium]